MLSFLLIMLQIMLNNKLGVFYSRYFRSIYRIVCLNYKPSVNTYSENGSGLKIVFYQMPQLGTCTYDEPPLFQIRMPFAYLSERKDAFKTQQVYSYNAAVLGVGKLSWQDRVSF